MLLVPSGAPVQLSGGVSTLVLAQVYRCGILPCRNAPLLTVITLGVPIVMPEPKTPHPASETAHPSAAAAAASRRARPARPGPVRSTCHLRCPILEPDGCRGGWAPRGNQTLASAMTAAVSRSGWGVNASRRWQRPPPAALSSRPGTTATPRRSAACANALESGEPGSRAQIVSPPAGGAQSQAGRNDRSAAATAS